MFSKWRICHRDHFGEWSPTIAIAKKHKEVWFRGCPLAPVDFLKADLHCFIIETCFLTYSPAKIDSLESAPVLFTKIPEFGKDLFLESVPPSDRRMLSLQRDEMSEWSMETVIRKFCLQGSSSRTKINVSSWNYLMWCLGYAGFPIPVMIAITRMLPSYMASIRAPQMTSACG